MKEQTTPVITVALVFLIGITSIDRSASSASVSEVSGIWSLEADIVVSYPSQYTCSFLDRIGDPSIPVTQSGDRIYADDNDPSPMPFSLRGRVNDNNVVFTITGFGITPGDGGCSLGSRNYNTTYSGIFNANTNTIQGDVSGSGEYSFNRDSMGNLIWQPITWTGSFTVTRLLPIILVHGWQGIPGNETRRCSEGIGRFGDSGVVNTFSDMAQWFKNESYDVWIAHLDTGPWYTPPIEDNAQCLRQQIAYVHQQTGQKVILVAHSMGGLVSRACLSYSDCRANVDSLFTLGSPHAGVNAGLLVKLLMHRMIPEAEKLPCEWQPAACQMTTDSMLMSNFNGRYPDQNGINYYFIGGMRTPWPLGWLILLLEGSNDGIVGSDSAVGRLYPTRINIIRGPLAGRFWTDETHIGRIGHPSYFEASRGTESQAFRCVTWKLGKRQWADCFVPPAYTLSETQADPVLSATTVEFDGHITSNQAVSHTVQVDTNNHSIFYLSWITGTLSVTLTQPDRQIITPAYANARPDVVTYTMSPGGSEVPPFAAYAFTSTVPGLYTVTITAEGVGDDGTPYLAFAALETDRTFAALASADLYHVSDTAIFTGTLHGPSGGITGADAQVEITRMDGMAETITLNDIGGGIYTGVYSIPDVPGYFRVTFTATGNDGGVAFTRQVDKLFTVAPHNAQLVGMYADHPEDRDGDGYNDTLALDVGIAATLVGTYTLSADLIAGGNVVAHATNYLTLTVGTQTVALQFDGWDIRQSHLDGPYNVTHVYLVDIGAGGIPTQVADDVWNTAAYDWRAFGFDRLYLPLILRNH